MVRRFFWNVKQNTRTSVRGKMTDLLQSLSRTTSDKRLVQLQARRRKERKEREETQHNLLPDTLTDLPKETGKVPKEKDQKESVLLESPQEHAKKVHEFFFWSLASSWVCQIQKKERVQIRRKVFLHTKGRQKQCNNLSGKIRWKVGMHFSEHRISTRTNGWIYGRETIYREEKQ